MDLYRILKQAYNFGRDNGSGRSEKNLNDFIEKPEIKQLLIHSVVVTSYCECAKPYREMNDPSNLCRKCLKTLKD